MLSKIIKFGYISWKYLNQPIFDKNQPTCWRINQFCHSYHLQLLENCWQKECSSQSHYTQ
jgi:hypothetical protein